MTLSTILVVFGLGLNSFFHPVHSTKFAPGKTYQYEYSGETELQDLGVLELNAKLFVSHLSDEHGQILCQMVVDSYKSTMTNARHGKNKFFHLSHAALDFSKWMAFDMSDHGEVRNIYYEKGEDKTVLNLKKLLLGTLSHKLMMTTKDSELGSRWAFRVNETGHQGKQESINEVESTKSGMKLRSRRVTPILENANHGHEKIVMYHTKEQVPVSVSIKEHFHSPTNPPASYTSKMPTDAMDAQFQMDIPSMKCASTGTMTLSKIITNTDLPNWKESYTNASATTLKLDQVDPEQLPLEAVIDDFHSNISCSVIQKTGDNRPAMQCSSNVVKILRQLNATDVRKLAYRYLHSKMPFEMRQSMVDSLGMLGTNESLSILTEKFLVSRMEKNELVLRSLVHFVGLRVPPPKIFLETIEDIVFHRPFDFPDREVTEMANNRAMLVLGAVVRNVANFDKEWSLRITQILEKQTGIHDPWRHRQHRSIMDNDQFVRAMNRRALYLATLGNAAIESSIPYIKSYLNTTESHLILRAAAVNAISQYRSDEAADLLLETMLNDEEMHVKQSAFYQYRNHPRGGNIDVVMDIMSGRSNSSYLSHEEHTRVRRSIGRTIARINQGFKFTLASPSTDWKKAIGPQKAAAIADALDKAWATLHLGIIDKEFSIVDAEVCLHASLSFDINVLKENKLIKVVKQALDFSKKVARIVNLIKQGVEKFNSINGIVKKSKFADPMEMLESLKESFETLPEKIIHLPKIGDKVLKTIGKFNVKELPPVVPKIQQTLTKAMTIFKDIKKDLMGLYNKVTNAVSVQFPWAFKTAMKSIEDIVDVLPKILLNPKTVIQTIATGIQQIGMAVEVILDCKRELIDDNILLQDEKPYWFDIKATMKDLWQDIVDIKDQVIEAKRQIMKHVPTEADVKRLVGEELSALKERALDEIIQVFEDEFSGPINDLKEVLEPLLTIKDVSEFIKAIREGWSNLKEMFKEARSLMSSVFGKKVHRHFPRTFVESATCGNGFYESDGQGNYEHPGVDLALSVGSEIVAPFNGKITQTGPTQITQTVADMDGIETIIDNVIISPGVNDAEKGPGESIGIVSQPSWCQDGHIHLAMRKVDTHSYVDPSRYIEEPPLGEPGLVLKCNHYYLKYLGMTITGGNILPQKKKEDKTPNIDGAPDQSELNVPTNDGGADRPSTDTGSPQLETGLKDLFSKKSLSENSRKVSGMFKEFDINKIPLKEVMETLKENPALKQKMDNLLEKIQIPITSEYCKPPEEMNEESLRRSLSVRGKISTGSKPQLIQRYLQTETDCPLKNLNLPEGSFCHFAENCMAMNCCIAVKIFTFKLTLNVWFDINLDETVLRFGVDKWSFELAIPVPTAFAHEGVKEVDLGFVGIGKIKAQYLVLISKDDIQLDFSIEFMSKNDSTVLKVIPLFKQLHISRKGLVILNSLDAFCAAPESLNEQDLRERLKSRGKTINGPRETLVQKYLESDINCPVKNLQLPPGVYCQLTSDCLSLKCCIPVKILVFKATFRLFATINPALEKFQIGFEGMTHTLDLPNGVSDIEDTKELQLSLWKIKSVKLHYNISFTDGAVKFDFDLNAFDNEGQAVFKNLDLLKGLVLPRLRPFVVNSVHALCAAPETLDDRSLHRALSLRGAFIKGSRKDLEERYSHTITDCPLKSLDLPSGVYCKFSVSCQSVRCCVPLKILGIKFTAQLSAVLDVNANKLTLGFEKWTYGFDLPHVNMSVENELSLDLPLFGVSQIKLSYNVVVSEDGVTADVELMVDTPQGPLVFDILKKLQLLRTFMKSADGFCEAPDTLDDQTLRNSLTMRGKLSDGSRENLIQRYLETDTRCPVKDLQLPPGMFCHFSSDCLSMNCCKSVDIFNIRYIVKISCVVDLKNEKIILGLEDWKKELALPAISTTYSDTLDTNIALFNLFTVGVYYKIDIGQGNMNVDISLTVDSDSRGIKSDIDLLKGLVLPYVLPEIRNSAHQFCLPPESLNIDNLLNALKLRNISSMKTDPRSELEKSYLKTITNCPIGDLHLAKGMYCAISSDCSSLSCCVPLVILHIKYTVKIDVKIDIPNGKISLGLEKWKTEIKIPTDTFRIDDESDIDIGTFSLGLIRIHYTIDIGFQDIILDMSVEVKSTTSNEFLRRLALFQNVILPKKLIVQAYAPISPSNTPIVPTIDSPDNSIQNIRDLSVPKLLELTQGTLADPMDLITVTKGLRSSLANLVNTNIERLLKGTFGNDFDLFDMTLKAPIKNFGPYKTEFFRTIPPIRFTIGPVPMSFEFGVEGFYGVDFEASLSLVSMKANVGARPHIGSKAWGELSIDLALAKASLRIDGYVLTTGFPTKVDVDFNKFPITLKARMDLELIPLKIELRGLCTISVFFARKTIVDILIWQYTSPTIKKNIFNRNNAEEDKSPPLFPIYSKAKAKPTRSRRSTNQCSVVQVKGLDYTEPAYKIELDVSDDKSDVTMTYDIGSHHGGNDALNGEPLGGISAVISRNLPSGVPLHFTVTATNTAGLSAKATCVLPTYDTTPPGGRITAEFITTSHPEHLRGSLLIVDDSPVITQLTSVGLGKGYYGSQIVPWFAISGDQQTRKPGSDARSSFTDERLGRLLARPFKTIHCDVAVQCAEECVKYSATKCQSFNYDLGKSGSCELFETIDGHNAALKTNGNYHYFERHGVGNLATLTYKGLHLLHNRMYYLNAFANNSLGYNTIMSSSGILVDLTPPLPGPLNGTLLNETTHEDCYSFTPRHLSYKCRETTTLPNYRYIIDGPGSKTVFNGPVQLVDKKYTRTNTMIAANWDGFHDNETDILVYAWSVGKGPCNTDVHPHHDPHAHIFSRQEWTHLGTIYPIYLPDGPYHITVRALNDIQFGGPMALDVCHSTPYIVDTSLPIIDKFENATYDESTYIMQIDAVAHDPHSDIHSVELGLGTNKRNTYIMSYVLPEDAEMPNLSNTYKIPDGLPVWGKLRVRNNVDLRAVGNVESPFIVDTTPPLPGVVLDGPFRGVDLIYQSSTTKYCANWKDFNDPESGIDNYSFEIVDTRNGTSLFFVEKLDHRVLSYCVDTLSLAHKEMYHSSVTAFNGGIYVRNVTSFSNGVLVDATPPVLGTVNDGIDPTDDIAYSANPAGISATYRGFHDPESKLKSITVLVYRTHLDGDEKLVHTENNVEPMSTAITLNHFHFHHRDTVRSEVMATNHAEASSIKSSDGFLVDLTKPFAVHLVDGRDMNTDLKYTSSQTELVASWMFEDDESGVVGFSVSAHQVHGGVKTKIYPSEGREKMWNEADGWVSDEPLNLNIGARYTVRVSAFNGAGLGAVYETSGVIVDPTPPRMLYAYAGTLAGDYEEVVDGFVWLNTLEGILASWEGVDAESDVEDYSIAVGTMPGGNDVSPYQSYGKLSSAYLTDLNLEYYNPAMDGPLYYVSVVARNGAGLLSTVMTSSPIKIVEGDKTGTVIDGSLIHEDIDYQSETETVSLHFHGYESALHGISHIEWCLGSSPLEDDVLPFTRSDILVQEDEEHTIGIGGQGVGQTIVPLSSGSKYFITVRAVTGTGNVLESSSDGFTIDTLPPNVDIYSISSFGQNETNGKHPLYRDTKTYFEASWNASDANSFVTESTVTVGSYPGGNDVVQQRLVTKLSTLPLDFIAMSQEDGVSSVLTINAVDKVNLFSSQTSATLIVDQSPPVAGIINCDPFITVGETLHCSWSGISDIESALQHFQIGVGLLEGDDSVYEFTSLNFGRTIEKVEIDGIGDTYTLGTKATELELLDAVCQRSLTVLETYWESFADPESGISRYELALGTIPGGSDIREFYTVSAEHTRLSVSNLDLHNIKQVFVTLRGYNGVGLSSTTSSNGIFISRISAGYPPIGLSYVYDGGIIGKDLDFQDENMGLQANWNFEGDPCPIQLYEGKFVKMDWSLEIPFEALPIGQTYGEIDDISLKDGESYFAIVTATNLLNFTYFLRSDGISVKLEPLIPGRVNDGDLIGRDLNFWTYIDKLSSNWDGFGVDKIPNAVIEKDEPSLDIEIGIHQTIDFYEVALGTDRRYPKTRDNVVPFLNVGTNTSWTFYNLNLVPKSAIYYFTVRAHSISTAVSEVTSNGIRVGYGGTIRKQGELFLEKYIASTSDLTFSWGQFEFTLPVFAYSWAMASEPFNFERMDCKEMQTHKPGSEITRNENIARAFDSVPLTAVQLNTMVKVDDLALRDRNTYTVVVVATDISGGCDIIGGNVSVDTTAPSVGYLGMGAFDDMDVLFTPRNDQISVSWDDFTDGESGIAKYEIALYSASNCQSSTASYGLVAESITLSNQESNYTFFNMELQSELPYFVHIKATNGAGLITEKYSKPILVDAVSPRAGTVKDGTSLLSDLSYQTALTEMKGAILYMPNRKISNCPNREFSMTAEEQSWEVFYHDFIYSLGYADRHWQTSFNKYNVGYSSDMGAELLLNRDVKGSRMVATAIQTKADILNGGIFMFKVKAASGKLKAVTSVSFSDSTGTEYSDFLGSFPSEDGYPEDNLGNHVFESNSALLRLVTTNNGFGFQIHPEIIHENQTMDAILVWWIRKNETMSSLVKLNFDPVQDWHTYEVAINEGNELDEEDVESWDMVISVDGIEMFFVTGIHGVTQNSNVRLAVYNRLGHVTILEDIFNAPSTSAFFKDIVFPPESDALCRHSIPFTAYDQPIAEFQAAVGTESGSANILPFRTIHTPCIPCTGACSYLYCDDECDPNALQEVTFSVDDLVLDYIDGVNEINGTLVLPPIYYLTVKGVTASGRDVLASSNGVYIDVTPPVMKGLYHIDSEWDSYEPTQYQGNNHTITVYWEATDEESQIVEFLWAIGSARGLHDVQSLTSVGTNSLATNTELMGLLYDNHTYYAKIVARNGAGLNTTVISSGVTIVMTTPVLTGTSSSVANAEPLSDSIASNNTVKTKRQDELEVAWEEPDTDQNIDGIYVGVGTEGKKEDVFPEMQTGYNQSGKLDLTPSGPKLTVGDNAEVFDVGGRHVDSKRRRRSLSSNFMMEPGRSLKINIRACNKGHRCGEIPTKHVMILRDGDSSALSVDGSLKYRIWQNGDSINISNYKNIHGEIMVAGGAVHESDMQMNYGSSESSNFKPYIVNREETQHRTNRKLRHRIRGWEGTNFFLTTVPGHPIPGGITVDVRYNNSLYSEKQLDFGPALLLWCSEEEMWAEAATSCLVSGVEVVHDIRNGILRTRVCDASIACLGGSQSQRVKRSNDEVYFYGPIALTVGAVDTAIANSPPVINSELTFTMKENSGTAVIFLTSTDPDGDEFVFKLRANRVVGSVSLSEDGKVVYTPAPYFSGLDYIDFIIEEQPTLSELVPLKTAGTLVANITPVKKNPVLMMIEQGNNVLLEPYVMNIKVEQRSARNDAYEDLELLFTAFDFDKDPNVILHMDLPSHGRVKLFNRYDEIVSFDQNCSKYNTWYNRSVLWDQLQERLRAGNTSLLGLPIPCNAPNIPKYVTPQWVISLVVYQPNEEFFGTDQIKIVAQDSDGAWSDVATINIFVLENLCQNKAKCADATGSYSSCDNTKRAFGFLKHGFTCVDCPLGFTGSFCETDINECMSNPCMTNFTCLDQINQYLCVCDDPDWPCWDNGLQDWHIVLICFSLLAIISLALVLLFFRQKKRRNPYGSLQSLFGSISSMASRHSAKVVPYTDNPEESLSPNPAPPNFIKTKSIVPVIPSNITPFDTDANQIKEDKKATTGPDEDGKKRMLALFDRKGKNQQIASVWDWRQQGIGTNVNDLPKVSK